MKKTLSGLFVLFMILSMSACVLQPEPTPTTPVATDPSPTEAPPTEPPPTAVPPTEAPPTEEPVAEAAEAATEEMAESESEAGGEAPAQEAEPQSFALPRYIQSAYAAGTRSEDGNPGPNYWQNEAVHTITVEVAPPSPTISATQEIAFTNNSPSPISSLPIRLYLNARRPEAIRERYVDETFFTEGIVIDEFTFNGIAVPWDETGETWAQETVKTFGPLPTPIQPGETINLGFKWHFDLSPDAVKEGIVDPTTFYVAYFFPRVATASDTDTGSGLFPGWDMEEYTYKNGRELNNDFADFTVNVVAPPNFIVWATGDLTNPDEVLQPEYAARLQESFTSDDIINIAQPDEIQQGLVTAQDEKVTWTWTAEHVPDFVFGLSDQYVWDAGSVVVDEADGRRASVQTAYAPEHEKFANMAQKVREILDFSSHEWPGIPYPWPKMTVFVGGADEEYPMMANDGPEGPSADFPASSVAAHEILHTYFPFYMGTDERRYPFMDEGITTSFEYLWNIHDLGQEAADRAHRTFRVEEILDPFVGESIPIITPADAVRGGTVSKDGYDKAALAFLALKEYMGDEAFRESLHAFIERWNGKRPLPWDLFNTFIDTSDQELFWFFDNWFYGTGYLDIAIGNVGRADSGGTAVTVTNPGGVAQPFNLIAYYTDGTEETFRQDAGVWQENQDQITIVLEPENEIVGIRLSDPIFLDSNKADNEWGEVPAIVSDAVTDLTWVELPDELTPGYSATLPDTWGQPSPPIPQFTSPDQRYIIVYQYVRGTTPESIVPQLGIPEPAADFIFDTRELNGLTWTIYATGDGTNVTFNAVAPSGDDTAVVVVILPQANAVGDASVVLDPALESFVPDNN